MVSSALLREAEADLPARAFDDAVAVVVGGFCCCLCGGEDGGVESGDVAFTGLGSGGGTLDLLGIGFWRDERGVEGLGCLVEGRGRGRLGGRTYFWMEEEEEEEDAGSLCSVILPY